MVFVTSGEVLSGHRDEEVEERDGEGEVILFTLLINSAQNIHYNIGIHSRVARAVRTRVGNIVQFCTR